MSIRPFFLRLALVLIALSTAVSSVVLAAEAPRQPRIHFMISESEYDTATTLPAFAKAELESMACSFSIAPADHPNDFPGMDALTSADLLFISVRRQAPTEEQMAMIRAHVAAGKPVVGIRTASHAFAPPKSKTPVPAPAGHAYWPEFDREVLGGNYSNHYGAGIPTFAKISPKAADHPVLADIAPEEFRVQSHLYKNQDLPASNTILMTARMETRPEVEPVAWVNTVHGRRVFYTSLGSPGDFEIPQFRRLLRNGIFWALNRPVTAKQPAPAAAPASPGNAPISLPPARPKNSSEASSQPLSPQEVLTAPSMSAIGTTGRLLTPKIIKARSIPPTGAFIASRRPRRTPRRRSICAGSIPNPWPASDGAASCRVHDAGFATGKTCGHRRSPPRSRRRKIRAQTTPGSRRHLRRNQGAEVRSGVTAHRRNSARSRFAQDRHERSRLV